MTYKNRVVTVSGINVTVRSGAAGAYFIGGAGAQAQVTSGDKTSNFVINDGASVTFTGDSSGAVMSSNGGKVYRSAENEYSIAVGSDSETNLVTVTNTNGAAFILRGLAEITFGDDNDDITFMNVTSVNWARIERRAAGQYTLSGEYSAMTGETTVTASDANDVFTLGGDVSVKLAEDEAVFSRPFASSANIKVQRTAANAYTITGGKVIIRNGSSAVVTLGDDKSSIDGTVKETIPWQ